jgi:hypothetical protein
MYSQLARSILVLAISQASRTATRAPPFVVYTGFKKSFQSVGHQQSQQALAESPSHDDFLQETTPFLGLTECLPEKNIAQDYTRSPVPTSRQAIQDDDRSDAVQEILSPAIPLYHRNSKFERVPYWQKIPRWSGISEDQFLTYAWGVNHKNSVRHE